MGSCNTDWGDRQSQALFTPTQEKAKVNDRMDDTGIGINWYSIELAAYPQHGQPLQTLLELHKSSPPGEKRIVPHGALEKHWDRRV